MPLQAAKYPEPARRITADGLGFRGIGISALLVSQLCELA
jgi:hypothetical protein